MPSTNPIINAVERWPGVTAHPHRFGGIEFQRNGHEIGHLHGSHQADLPFPVRLRRELVAAGKAELHHMLPDTGWVSFYIRNTDDIAGAIALFRLNYERLHARQTVTEFSADDPTQPAAHDGADDEPVLDASE